MKVRKFLKNHYKLLTKYLGFTNLIYVFPSALNDDLKPRDQLSTECTCILHSKGRGGTHFTYVVVHWNIHIARRSYIAPVSPLSHNVRNWTDLDVSD